MQYFIHTLFSWLSCLSLSTIHRIGNFCGWLLYHCSSRTRKITLDNLKQSGIITDNKKHLLDMAKKNTQESVKCALELSIAWFRSPKYIVSLFKEIYGWEYVEAALKKNQGLLLITPHLGNYDLAGRIFSEKLDCTLTAMYRPPKQKCLEPIMNQGRIRGKGQTAPANAQGVRKIVRALKNHEAVVILPDQVPQAGEGVMVNFFNKPAYTMSLAARLLQMPQVTPLIFFGERIEKQGFNLRIFPFSGQITDDKTHNAQLINDNIEAIIRQYPSQYLFSYNRYKIPAGVDINKFSKI